MRNSKKNIQLGSKSITNTSIMTLWQRAWEPKYTDDGLQTRKLAERCLDN